MERKYNLLVADDHRIFLEGLKYLLKDEINMNISDTAANGREAIDKCKSGNIDLVIMDISMPVIDGIEATREIKRHRPKLKVIMLSMLSDIDTVNKSLEAGADAFVIKDSGSEELLKAMRMVVKNKIYISTSIAHLFTDYNNINKSNSQFNYIRFSQNIISPREQSILKLIVEGFTNKEIAALLFISVKTVDTHRKNMLAKLNLPNTAALVKFAFQNKLV
jgi:DNA-binding NarL/FixJ family response regulator